MNILLDGNIHLDRIIETGRPDIVVEDKWNVETLIIDITMHGDICVKEKDAEKVEKYQHLVLELH